ncbi:MAG: penicillin-binding protein 2 [Thermoleophilia bacterium]
MSPGGRWARRPGGRGGASGGGWAPNLTPGGAVRIAVLGGIALSLLAVLLVRLWFLQIIGEERYAAAAESNHLRTVEIEAPRGNILDRNGVPIVTNRRATNVVARPNDLKGERRIEVLRRLAPKVRVPLKRMLERMKYGDEHRPFDAVVLAENVDADIAAYVAMRTRQYPGVALAPTYIRAYPEGDLAAHILGQTGKIDASELAAYRKRGYAGDEVIGKGGIEYQYEAILKGTPGVRRVEVDASGNPVAAGVTRSVAPVPGRDLRLTIDARIQRALQDAIEEQAVNRGAKGAGVVLDPNTGEVIAIASYPTFDPSIFIERKAKVIDALYKDKTTPNLNRAIQATYPPGSTFKVVTGSLALHDGFITADQQLDSPSTIELHETPFQNYRKIAHGLVDMRRALEVSSDTYFFQIGDDIWERDDKADPMILQRAMTAYGLGSLTGIDLPSETTGALPTRAWKLKTFCQEGCDAVQRTWLAADTIQMTVGQGFVLTTPLQMARVYASIAGGGVLRTPTVARAVTDPNGRVVRRLSEGRPTRTLPYTADELGVIRDGLYRVANGSEGTASEVFRNLPEGAKVAGKTGTAEQKSGEDQSDHSWFIGYAPYDNPKYVVAIVIERAGVSGSQAGAPAACDVFASALRFDPELCGVATEDTN